MSQNLVSWILRSRPVHVQMGSALLLQLLQGIPSTAVSLDDDPSIHPSIRAFLSVALMNRDRHLRKSLLLSFPVRLWIPCQIPTMMAAAATAAAVQRWTSRPARATRI